MWTVGADGIVNNGDDVAVIGPVAATQGCGPIVNCQFAAGTAILALGTTMLSLPASAAAPRDMAATSRPCPARSRAPDCPDWSQPLAACWLGAAGAEPRCKHETSEPGFPGSDGFGWLALSAAAGTAMASFAR